MGMLDRLALRLGRLLAWGFLVIVALMVYEVAARYAFNAPTFWAHEIAGLIAAVVFVFGGAYCMAEGTHMRITAFTDAMGPKVKLLSRYLSLTAGIIYLAGLAYATWRMSLTSLFRFDTTGAWDPERSGSTWNTAAPSLLKFALFLGAVLFLLVVLRRLFAKPNHGD